MQAARWLATALFVAAVPVFLVLSNVRVATMEPRVYEYGFNRYGVAEVTGIERPELNRAAVDIVRYFGDSRTLLTTRVEVGGQKQPLFTSREALHMQDVKTLFRRAFFLHEVAFGYIAIYITAVFLWARERPLRRLSSQLIAAGSATAGLLALAALASLVSFDALFYGFHLVSFANDLWQLDPARDRLIQMFPRDFWFTVTIGVGVATVMQGLLLVLAGYALRAWFGRPSLALPRSTMDLGGAERP